jgi:hypothetical protein
MNKVASATKCRRTTSSSSSSTNISTPPASAEITLDEVERIQI